MSRQEIEDTGEEEVVEMAEMESMRTGRPTTDANVFFQLLFGTVATIGLAFGVGIFKGHENASLRYLYEIINERGWVQYGEVLMSFMVVALMILKSRIVKNQLRVVASNPIPLDLDLSDDEQLHNLRDSMIKREEFSWSIILNRIDRAIALWLSTKDVGRVSGWAAAESSRDSASSDSSYSLCRVLIWAIPILGFIGTVLGLATAVSGFGAMGESADISVIKEAIGKVTVGLGMAFDTTLLALLLTVMLMFPLSFIQRNEENLFVELDNYLDDMFMARLPSPEQQPIVIENLEDSIEAAFRRYIPDPDRYDEVFTRAIDKAANSIEERFGNLTKNYEVTLKEVTGQLAGNLSGVGENLRSSITASLADMKQQDGAMLEARKVMAADEAQKFAAMLNGVATSSQGLAEQYRKVASELQVATDAAMGKSLQAANQLAGKMDEVSQLAAGIKDLLNIEKAIAKSMDGISASEDFRRTLEDLRTHLATTTDFCNRLNKPRVITLREEVG
jgi:biopolymer transport protein ExbB/TolQ